MARVPPLFSADEASARPSAAASHAAASHAAALAARLPALLIAARHVAATVAQGTHGRRRVGSGETFWQFRRYQTGDAASLVDWRQSARRQAPYVRQNEWAAAQSVWLWLDRSASMDYGSAFAAGVTKEARAALLLLALAELLLRGGERVALLEAGPEDPPAGGGRHVLEDLALRLARPAPESLFLGIPPDRALPRWASLVWFGDFLGPPEEITRRIELQAGNGVSGHLMQVLDPAEEDLPFTGRTRFEGLEGEAPFLAPRAEGLRDAYRGRLKAQRDALGEACRRCGWSFSTHRTDQPPARALLALFAALSETAPGSPVSGSLAP